MNEAIIVAIISAVGTLVGVILSNKSMLDKQQAQLDRELAVYQARTNERIDELTREVREHNEVVKRTYAMEEQLKGLSARVGRIENRPSA